MSSKGGISLEEIKNESVDLERIPMEEVFEQLKCTREGLSADEGASRLQVFGPNKLEEKKESLSPLSLNFGRFFRILPVYYSLAFKQNQASFSSVLKSMAKDYQNYSWRLSLLVSCSLLVLLPFSSFHVQALNIGVQAADSAVSLGKGCSRKCESEFCSVPPFLRYGKYCGLLYSGCPGEKPCDGLDACCMKHDACIQAKNNDYLSQECSQKFISCMNKFKTGARTFKGNKCKVDEVIDVISVVMEAALLAGRALHKP